MPKPPRLSDAFDEGRRRLDSGRRALDAGLQRVDDTRRQLGVPTVRRRRGPVDLSGWTAPEVTAFLAQPRAALLPPRRAGHAAVTLVNELSGVLPTEAVLLARAVADAAPPAGRPISPTLADIVGTYLPASLAAYQVGSSGGRSEAAAHLLVDQLRLLHEASVEVRRAEAEHDETELRVQQVFLRDRFAQLSENALDLPPESGAVAAAPGPPSAAAGLTVVPTRGRHRLDVERDPVTVFTPDPDSKGILELRLAIPRGLPATMGVVVEKLTGATSFAAAKPRPFRASRRQVGFGEPQVDVSLTLPLADVRRFVVQVTCVRRGTPVQVVLFTSEGSTNAAQVPTLLTRRVGAGTTVVASGYDTTDGLFLRNESTVWGTLRAACEGYGFTGVTWLSPDTPAV